MRRYRCFDLGTNPQQSHWKTHLSQSMTATFDVSSRKTTHVHRPGRRAGCRSGKMLLEQFGGGNGELAAAMQYSIQGLNCEDPERKRPSDGYRH